MTVPFEPILTRWVGDESARTLAHYRDRKGYEAARKALTEMEPSAVIELVKESGLRGRGGAGFSCGLKWGFVPRDSDKPRYLVVNADESEPGTFKDRAILEWDPHTVLEGALICAAAVGIHQAYVYIRGEYVKPYRILQAAVDEAYAAGVLGPDVMGTGFALDVTVHRGAGAYICGEETGMLSSLEGGRGYPKIKPPFPAVEGLFRCPTVVNNVETIASLPSILTHGAAWFRQWGTDRSPGFKIVSISGHVARPGNYEIPLGMPLAAIIEDLAGGVWKGRKLRACIPGGSSAPPLTAEDVARVTYDFESVAEAGSMLGSGAIIVLDDQTCMVDACWNLMRFYHHESCGQCTPCREGTGWLEKIFHRLERGQGRKEDLELIDQIGANMCGKTVCVLADAAALPARGFLAKFRDEFARHIAERGCPYRNGDGPRPMEPAERVEGMR